MSKTINKNYEVQSTGSNTGAWGGILNTEVISIIDQNFGGLLIIPLTNANVTLTSTDVQNSMIRLTGTLTGPVTITLPSTGSFYLVENNTSGAYAVTFTNGVGASATPTQGAITLLMCDYTNNIGVRVSATGLTSLLSGFGLSGGPISTTGTLSISTSAPPFGFDMPINMGLSVAVASNALTITLTDQAGSAPSATSPVLVPFRSATVATGSPSWLSVTASNTLTLSTGSSLGTSNGTAFRIWILGINDGGTFRLGAINCSTSSGITPLNETTVISSTAEGGAGGATSAGVVYSPVAVTSKSSRILGYFEYSSGLTVAGTWNFAPDKVQLFGPGVKIPGDVVQVRNSSTGAYATGTNNFSVNDSIPTNTVGNEFQTITITPTSKANRIIVEGRSNLAYYATSGYVSAALFQDSTSNALAAVTKNYTQNAVSTLILNYAGQVNTTSSTTFKIRAGGNNASTVSLNGLFLTGRQFGGVFLSSMTATEYMG